jgi:hypothetical protein
LLGLSSLAIAGGWTSDAVSDPNACSDRLLAELGGAELIPLLAAAESMRNPDLSPAVRTSLAASVEALIARLVSLARQRWA